AMADDYRKGIRLILIINVPAALGLALLSRPIIDILFLHGEFTAEDAQAMAPILALFAIGLPFFSVVNLTVRAFYALKDTKTPVRIALVDFIINLALSLVLMRRFGAAGLVLASTTAIIVQTLLLKRALTRKLPEMEFAPLWPSVGKVIVATLAMGLVVAGGWRWLEGTALGERAKDLLGLGALIPLGVTFYAAMLWVLKIEGREDVSALVAKIRARFA
ncbi:MAG: lipid II flippase MurJ, partial [Pseudomonadota bacterium]